MSKLYFHDLYEFTYLSETTIKKKDAQFALH